MDQIRIKGAREHNLKNIDIDLPRDKLVVITGLSGSGKSSLAFDTIYADGQRRYVESLSSYARQFLEMMEKPDVDSIEGLSPAISIEQKTTSRNPRSTVGTVTEIYDYARLLFARVGIPYSPATGKPIESQTTTQMVDAVMKMPQDAKLYLMAPVVRGRKGEYRKELAGYRTMGYQRVKIDGEIYEISDVPELDKKFKHDIDVVIDRVQLRDDLEARIAEAVENSLRIADGLFVVENADTGERQLFSSKFSCPESGFSIPEIEPRLFSFNNPFGACPSCDGLGEARAVNADLVVPDRNKSLGEGAIQPWTSSSPYFRQTLEGICAYYKVSMNTPFAELPEKVQDVLLYGGKDEILFSFDDGLRSRQVKRPFEGIVNNLERRYRETDSSWAREDIAKYQSVTSCPSCKGYRLKKEALCVKIEGKHIGEISRFSILDARQWFHDLTNSLTGNRAEIAARILKEINERLGFLLDVGLQYLSLSRSSASLSGGESQRIRLASQIGSGLTGVLYVLDEPSIGLHQRDNARLLKTLEHLRDLGNTVIVVEHDEDAIRSADYLVDIGPGAGVHGGYVVAKGLPEEVFSNPKSITGQYLSGKKSIPVPKRRRRGSGFKLSLKGACEHNLKDVSIDIPLATLSCITGVSGSGKSTLIIETLYRALSRRLMHSKETPAAFKAIYGVQYLDKVIDIDQSPIGRTPRSNPATYTGAFTPIREWFAGLPDAKVRGYSASRFSFNVKGGRCETCQGDGVMKIEMHFLPDVHVSCEQCKGMRYNRETLDVKFKGKNIYDILSMTVEEAAEFFAAVPAIREKMDVLNKVGLGYIKIGQSATTLSGGEAQRIKLAKELSRKSTGRTLYILDEPTTGLHFEDIRKLLEVLQALVEQGNTVLVIEHNLEVIKTADYVVDMGPDGGNEGGNVVAFGTPEDIAKCKESHTGYYLKNLLKVGKDAK